MHVHDPEGFEKRSPSAKKIRRITKGPIGIHERWAAGSYDKLNKIGFPIWAIVDVATGKWLGAWVVPSDRLNETVAYLFLSCVEQYGGTSPSCHLCMANCSPGLPLQTPTDCGSEMTKTCGLINALR